jgi:hypothetical protein
MSPPAGSGSRKESIADDITSQLDCLEELALLQKKVCSDG